MKLITPLAPPVAEAQVEALLDHAREELPGFSLPAVHVTYGSRLTGFSRVEAAASGITLELNEVLAHAPLALQEAALKGLIEAAGLADPDRRALTGALLEAEVIGSPQYPPRAIDNLPPDTIEAVAKRPGRNWHELVGHLLDNAHEPFHLFTRRALVLIDNSEAREALESGRAILSTGHGGLDPRWLTWLESVWMLAPHGEGIRNLPTPVDHAIEWLVNQLKSDTPDYQGISATIHQCFLLYGYPRVGYLDYAIGLLEEALERLAASAAPEAAAAARVGLVDNARRYLGADHRLEAHLDLTSAAHLARDHDLARWLKPAALCEWAAFAAGRHREGLDDRELSRLRESLVGGTI